MRNCFLYLSLFAILQSSAQLVPFRLNDSWGYSDSSGKITIEPQYAFADFFTKDKIAFIKKDSFFYGINSTGKTITPALLFYGQFRSDLCPVMNRDSQSYYIDYTGNKAFPMEFDAAENFSENLAVVSLHKKLGIIDTKGNWVRKPDFDTSSVIFKSGFLMAISKGKYFYIDKHGKTLNLPDTVLPGGIFSEGLAAVYVNKSYNSSGEKMKTSFLEFIDSTGTIVLSHFMNQGIDYSEYIMLEKEFRDGKAIVKSKNEIGWDYYFIDTAKRFSPLYASARHLGNKLFLGAIGYYMSDIRILDSNFYVSGQFQNKPTQVGEFGNGLLPVRDKDGNWGYIDANCNLVIPYKYAEAYTFQNGYAFIKLNGKFGVIDVHGKEFFYDKTSPPSKN